MTYTTQLSCALASACQTTADGYEVDQVQYCNFDGDIEISCGEHLIATLENQDIEIDAHGQARVPGLHDGPDADMVTFVFKATVPMQEKDLLK